MKITNRILMIVLVATLTILFNSCKYKNKINNPKVDINKKLEVNIEENTLNVINNKTTDENIDSLNSKPDFKVIDNLVRIQDVDDTIKVDLKYSTQHNFTGKIIYPFNTCLLREETAKKLSKANKTLGEMGYTIKIYDGYRPPFAQQMFWDIVKDERYVANPSKKGSIHSRGGAVDITIVDENGVELEMPSEFDDFTQKASRTNTNISVEAKRNLQILTSAMISNGFNCIESEWWHFNDINSHQYEIVDIDPKLFED